MALITWDLKCRHGNTISKKSLAKKQRKSLVFVSYCPKSFPKPLIEPKMRINIQF